MGAALALLSGCLLPWLLPENASLTLLLVVLLAGLLSLRWPATRLLSLIALGFLLTEWRIQQGLTARLPIGAESEVVELHGTVTGLPEADARSLQFELRVIEAQPAAVSPLRRVRLSWYDTKIEVHPGQQWRLSVKLKRPHGLVNPAGFDFERHALARGIDAQGYVQRGELLGSNGWHIDRLRELGSAALADKLGSDRATGLLQALVYGDTRALSAADWTLFRRTGTTHLIAISGSHIGVVALAAGALLAFFWGWLPVLRRWPRLHCASLAGWAAALIYCLLAGFEIPAQRTLLGISVVAFALLRRRQLAPWTTFNAALIVVLLYDPLSPLSAGFWLSFGAVAWLLLIFAGRWRRPAGWQELLEAQAKIALLMLPLTLLLFQQAALLAPLTNLWAVPLVSVLVVPIALLGALFLPVPLLGAGLLKVASWLAQLFLYGLDVSASSGLDGLVLPVPGVLAIFLGICGSLWLIAPRGIPGRAAAPLLWLPLLLPKASTIPPGDFELTVFDVGQGLSVLVQTAGHNLLYDTGPGSPSGQPVAASAVLPSLATLGVQRLDTLVISHADDDHAGGLNAVRAGIPIDRLLSSAPELGLESCQSGQRWTWDGIEFEFLHPGPGLPYLRNESSCVLRIHGPHGSALLPGDIGSAIEERLLKHQAGQLPSTILLSPHHGSAGSSTPQFVQAVAAQWVLHATGYRDRFDFPRIEVVQRYRDNGARQLDTASSGAVTMRFDARSREWQVSAERSDEPRRWRDLGSEMEIGD